MSEFDLIRRYFTRSTPGALLGVGDDAALLKVSEGNVMAVSSDMLVSGTHFLPDADPFFLGQKALAVNLSDMAAMGATPRWATLALALPDENEVWLEQFSAGFFVLAQKYGVELVGGDTTRGPLNLCVTIFGEVPVQQALRRSGAQIGDEIWVSGTLGDAALALAHLQGRIELNPDELAVCLPRLYQPQPRVNLGLALRGLANCVIDISDGFLGDLGHILEASNVGAEIESELLPVSSVLRDRLTSSNLQASPERGGTGKEKVLQHCVLSGGDDYELCFTASPKRHAEILSVSAQLNLPLTCAGIIVAEQGCIVQDVSGHLIEMEDGGYDHFR